MSDRGCRIAGWGAALPAIAVTSAELAARIESTEDWIVERSGIQSRRVAAGPYAGVPPEDHPAGGLGTTGRLAVEAGRAAMAEAGVAPAEIGLLILCTTTPDQAVPATSSPVAAALGIRAGAMDLNAACAGFTYGLVVASAMVASGLDRVLLIGAETLSRITNWDDRTNAFLFGDGAGAVVLESVPDGGCLLGWDLGVDGSLEEILYADHGSDGMVMRGQEVFRRAVLVTTESARTALERAKIEPADVALFVPHQANVRIMRAVAERLGIPSERVASVIHRTGNTSSASIPLALVDSIEAGRLHPGDAVLFAGFGAGMTWASAVWRWTPPTV